MQRGMGSSTSSTCYLPFLCCALAREISHGDMVYRRYFEKQHGLWIMDYTVCIVQHEMQVCRYALLQQPAIWMRECGIPITADAHEQRSASERIYRTVPVSFQEMLKFEVSVSVSQFGFS
jgi:hypothetical protein